MKKLFLLSCFLFVLSIAFAQDQNVWNNKKCAVVLTYDDALSVQLDNVIPVLDSLKFKATFYISGYSEGFSNRLAEWRSVAKNGHELGNHTLFHPCTGKIAEREWVTPDYDLSNYTMKRMTDEIRMTNTLLKSLDGKKKEHLLTLVAIPTSALYLTWMVCEMNS